MASSLRALGDKWDRGLTGLARLNGVTLTDATDHVTTAITATGGTDYVDVGYLKQVSISVVNGAANVCTFTVEGSLGGTNFSTIAYGQGSSGAYTQSAHSSAAAEKTILFLPPDDYVRYVRVNISAANANGCTFTVYGRG